MEVAHRIGRRLRAEEWSEHEQLPSASQFAAEYGVSLTMVKSSLTVLKNNQLIYGIAGKGTFAGSRAPHAMPPAIDRVGMLQIELAKLQVRVAELEKKLM